MAPDFVFCGDGLMMVIWLQQVVILNYNIYACVRQKPETVFLLVQNTTGGPLKKKLNYLRYTFTEGRTACISSYP
jgi:hypothetical protein